MMRQRAVCLASIAVVLIGCLSHAYADATWTGMGGDNLWSNPNNWAPVGVPSAGSHLTVTGTMTEMVQDIASPFLLNSLTFSNSFQLTLNGSPIALASGGTISSTSLSAFPLDAITAPLLITGSANIGSPTSAGGITLASVSGAGDLIVRSGTTIHTADYTGQTFVQNARLAIGGISGTGFHIGQTSGQGSYHVTSGDLVGNGTIGLIAGAAVNLGADGRISPGNNNFDGDVATLHVLGSVVLGSAARYDVSFNGPSGSQLTSDLLVVHGLLDLSAANDTLYVGVPPISLAAESFVVASYESRLGEFDVITGTISSHVYQVTYTSAAGAGPGQVILVLPEPGAVALTALMPAMMGRRRVRSRHAVATLVDAEREDAGEFGAEVGR